ncbi:G-protein-signaling modulator 1-like [Pocillopora verrucosa]|uniref:G-protein-signaling modulator 1-like n=1 Tax=Pocillopora verrucosa TaxID=203993 RepID=UPI0033421101
MGKATCYGKPRYCLFQSLGQYAKAREYLQKALVIKTESGDRKGEASGTTVNLGTVFMSARGQLRQALKSIVQKAHLSSELKWVTEKERQLTTEILVTCSSKRRGKLLRNLGNLFESLGQYDKAEEYLQRALVIKTEIGDRNGKATCYGNLGTVFHSLGQYAKAREYLQKALVIRTEIGDREGEASDYGNLGTVFMSLGQYDKAQEYLQKALVIRTEIGDREGEASDYGNLGTVFMSLGQYDKAQEYLQKALVIRTEIGDRKGEATDYGNLGYLFESLGQYDKAEENGKATCYGNLSTVFQSLGQYAKAREYLQKALVIRTEIGDREGEASDSGKPWYCVYVARGNTTRLKSISKERLSSKLKLATEMGKQHVIET